jgi:hypothetical protein
MKKLVGPIKPVSRNKLSGLLEAYRKGEKRTKRLSDALDVDYLDKLNPEEREFFVNFHLADQLLDCTEEFPYTKKAMDNNNAYRKDIFNRYKAFNYRGDTPAEKILDESKIESLGELGDGDRKDRKYKQNYSIKDYIPSSRFYPNLIIRMIDEERAQKKANKTLRVVKNDK